MFVVCLTTVTSQTAGLWRSMRIPSGSYIDDLRSCAEAEQEVFYALWFDGGGWCFHMAAAAAECSIAYLRDLRALIELIK